MRPAAGIAYRTHGHPLQVRPYAVVITAGRRYWIGRDTPANRRRAARLAAALLAAVAPRLTTRTRRRRR